MIRTGYSFRVAFGHLTDVTDRLVDIKWKHAPITDRMSTFGFNRWNKMCKKKGLIPVFGVELGVSPTWGDKLPRLDFWKFIAINSITAINELIGKASLAESKEPCLLYDDALNAKGVIKISGESLLIENLRRKPPADFYIGLSPAMPAGLYKEAKKRKLQFCAIPSNFYPKATDEETYRIALSRRSNTQTYPMWIVDDKEWKEAMWFVSEADKSASLKNRDAILKRCAKVELKKATLIKPEKKKTLRQMCIEGAKLKGVNLTDKVYSARLDRELMLIDQKKYEDYFYIIADMVQWARKRMCVGPARGSSCGSLVCYLLDITTVDPIPFGLLFERFIDLNRMDLPDIDIDFSDTRRKEVFEYAENKYGRDHVARLGTVGMFMSKSAINTTAIGLRIPQWKIDKVMDTSIKRSSGDSRAMLALTDTLQETENGRELLKEYPEVIIAGKMEGHPQNASQHAAGIVITDLPVNEYVAVDLRSRSVMCDKKDAEDYNLLKIDALGLTQMSVFERALELIGEGDNYRFFESLPLDDKKAFDVLNKGHFSGVFQFNGPALKQLTSQVKVEKLEDIVAITALARPGPLASGGTSMWVRVKNGQAPIADIHPRMTEATIDSLGVITYQEQVMKIAREIGGLSWEDTSTLRKAMSQSLGDEFFEQFWEKFKIGAVASGIEERVAREIWDNINTFGSWGFNKSHAVAYGLVSYYCCWLKAHYPVEFAAATLDAETDTDRIILILRELEAEGVGYVPFDIKLSGAKWQPVVKGKKRYLVGPLTLIDKVGPAICNEIINAREAKKPLRDTLKKRLAEAKTAIDTLYPVKAALDRIAPDGLSEINIRTKPTLIKDLQDGVSYSDIVLIGILKKIAPRDENDSAKVAARGHRLSGPSMALNMTLADDTGELLIKVGRKQYEEIGKPIQEKATAGKTIVAAKGRVWDQFKMLFIDRIQIIGEVE